MAGLDPVTSVIPATTDLVQLGLPDANTAPYAFPVGAAGYLFDRSWVVTLTGLTGVRVYNSLRTVFDIEKTPTPQANKGKVQLYNLNDLSRSLFLTGARLTLAVGYAGVTLPIFTNANVVVVNHERKGADIITTFECGEGERELQATVCNLTLPAGTSVAQVVSQLIVQMGLIQGATIGLIPRVYNSGVVLAGKCSDVLTKVLQAQNLNWSVQHGKIVQIVPKGAVASPTPVVVTATTGLIGVPNLGRATGGSGTFTFTSLIQPQFVPNALVTVISRFFTITGTIKNVKIDGDTHGSKWTAKCECTAVAPPVATP